MVHQQFLAKMAPHLETHNPLLQNLNSLIMSALSMYRVYQAIVAENRPPLIGKTMSTNSFMHCQEPAFRALAQDRLHVGWHLD